MPFERVGAFCAAAIAVPVAAGWHLGAWSIVRPLSGAPPMVYNTAHAVLADAVKNLRVLIDEQRALVTQDPLPEVTGDRVQLTQLLQNLIANGIKFRRDEAPRVHVSVAPGDAGAVFSVEDNGIGIEPQFAERVFVIFQRLDPRERYPGTGIGLALCRKIVA